MKVSLLHEIEKRIVGIREFPETFDELAIEIFQFQAKQNPVYKQFLKFLGKDPSQISKLSEIPFLPISFFKTQAIKSGSWDPEAYFLSSGTTGQVRSQHFIRDLSWYHTVSKQIFTDEVIDLSGTFLIGLLPNYLENPHSSLIEMVRHLAAESKSPIHFCKPETEAFLEVLQAARTSGRKPVIFSVTYALLHLAEKQAFDLSDCLIIETGGMKGLGVEMAKHEFRKIVHDRFAGPRLVSEYGMTELQSQAYAQDEWYQPGFGMKVFVRQLEDPLGGNHSNGRGGLNIIDLANWSTCSFIATDDIGEIRSDGKFAVFGRADGAEIRGCNLLFA